MIKFYSTLSKEIFETWEDAEAAEIEAQAKIDKAELELEQKRKAKAEVEEAYKHFASLRKEYDAKYGNGNDLQELINAIFR